MMSADKAGLIRSLRLRESDRDEPPEPDAAPRGRAGDGPVWVGAPAARMATPDGRRTWPVAAGAGLAGLALGCAAMLWAVSGRDDVRQPVVAAPLPAASAATTPAPDPVASGYVVARRQATVAAEITGRLVDVRIEEGQFVRRGQILAVLDSSVAQAELAMSRNRGAVAVSNVAASAAELKEADQADARLRQLLDRGFATRSDRERSEARASAATAQLAAARANAALAVSDQRRAALQVDRHVIRAPFSGMVVSKNAQTGEIISPISAGGGFTRTGVATLVDMDSLEFEVDVSEQYISRVRPGQPVEARLSAYPDRVFAGHVVATVPTADRNRSTVKVRIAFTQTGRDVLPDMAVRVAFLAK